MLKAECLEELRTAIYRFLNVIRVYTKEPGKHADKTAPFTCPVGSTLLEFAAVVHQAYVDVNEEGTEAAAATAVAVATSLPPSFRADHPFLFLIRDTRSGSILFLGRLVNPK